MKIYQNESNLNLQRAQLQNKFYNYFRRLNISLTKPETRIIRDMVLSILKSQQITLNQIGIHLLDSIKLKSTLERFRRQLSKPDLLKMLISQSKSSIRHILKRSGVGFILMIMPCSEALQSFFSTEFLRNRRVWSGYGIAAVVKSEWAIGY